MNFNLESVKYFISKNAFIIIALSILGIYLLPYYYNIENSKFLIHDNLDSNVVWFKNLAESGHLFNHKGGIIEITLNGLPRKFYPSDLNIRTITYYIFSPINAYCILKILIHLIAFIGMYLLVGYLLKANDNNRLISAAVALAFSLIPFWPSGGLTVAGQPLLLFSFLNLINKRNLILSWIIIFFFPFFSSLFLGNVFFMSIGFLVFIILTIKTKKLYPNVILACLIFTISSILIEHRIFEVFFIEKNVLQRTISDVPNALNLSGLIGVSAMQSLKGQYHFFGRIWPFIPIILCFNFFILKSKKVKKYLMLLIVLIAILSIGSTIRDLNFVIKYLPFFQFFNPRFISLNVIIWYIILTLSLSEFSYQHRFYKILNSSLLIGLISSHFFNLFGEDYQDSNFIENSFYHTYINKSSKTHQSFNQFYNIMEFKKISKYIDQKSKVCCIGFQPEIAQFNGLKTLGGYRSTYPHNKCLEIRDILKNDKKICSSRFYINLSDIENKNFDSKAFVQNKINFIISKHKLKQPKLQELFSTKNFKVYSINV